jgi:hypothetical protein
MVRPREVGDVLGMGGELDLDDRFAGGGDFVTYYVTKVRTVRLSPDRRSVI